jgi:hypothetical protein
MIRPRRELRLIQRLRPVGLFNIYLYKCKPQDRNSIPQRAWDKLASIIIKLKEANLESFEAVIAKSPIIQE